MRREEVELFQNMNGQVSVSFEHVSESCYCGWARIIFLRTVQHFGPLRQLVMSSSIRADEINVKCAFLGTLIRNRPLEQSRQRDVTILKLA